MPRINHNRAIVLELSIIAAYNYDIEGFAPALELLASGRLPLDALIEADDVLLDDVLGTMHRLAAGELPGKVMVRPEVQIVTVSEPEFAPRLNHVAISMDPALLDDRGRAELLDFYGDVFGWTEGDNTGEIGNPLIMYTGAFGQFVYLLPGRSVPARAGDGPLRRAGRDARAAAGDRRPGEGAPARPTSGSPSSTCTPARRTGPTADYTLTSAYIGFVMPAARGAPAPRTSRTLSGRRKQQRPRRDRLTLAAVARIDIPDGPGRRLRDGVVAAPRDGGHGRPHDHHRVPTQQAARRSNAKSPVCASRSSTTAPPARRSGRRR